MDQQATWDMFFSMQWQRHKTASRNMHDFLKPGSDGPTGSSANMPLAKAWLYPKSRDGEVHSDHDEIVANIWMMESQRISTNNAIHHTQGYKIAPMHYQERAANGSGPVEKPHLLHFRWVSDILFLSVPVSLCVIFLGVFPFSLSFFHCRGCF